MMTTIVRNNTEVTYGNQSSIRARDGTQSLFQPHSRALTSVVGSRHRSDCLRADPHYAEYMRTVRARWIAFVI